MNLLPTEPVVEFIKEPVLNQLNKMPYMNGISMIDTDNITCLVVQALILEDMISTDDIMDMDEDDKNTIINAIAEYTSSSEQRFTPSKIIETFLTEVVPDYPSFRIKQAKDNGMSFIGIRDGKAVETTPTVDMKQNHFIFNVYPKMFLVIKDIMEVNMGRKASTKEHAMRSLIVKEMSDIVIQKFGEDIIDEAHELSEIEYLAYQVTVITHDMITGVLNNSGSKGEPDSLGKLFGIEFTKYL